VVSASLHFDNREYLSNPIFSLVIKMTRAYCLRCEEVRTDSRDDAWGFVWYAGAPICQRCQSVVEITSNGQENEVEEIDQEHENGGES